MARRPSAGFSLVELCVAIGIIAVLIGLLFPAISTVRQRNLAVRCVSNQRQLLVAAFSRAQESGGYLPLAGMVRLPGDVSGYGSLPPTLNDSGRKRYLYIRESGPTYFTPTAEQVAPFPLALVPQLGLPHIAIDEGTVVGWRQVERDNAALAMFRCPGAARPDPPSPLPSNGLVFGAQGFVTLNDIEFDYALNEGVLGFQHDAAGTERRMRGQIARVRDPSHVLLLADADISRHTSQLLCWTPAPDQLGPASMGDVLNGAANIASSPPLDKLRHAGKINVALLDGHVETVAIEAKALNSFFLLPP